MLLALAGNISLLIWWAVDHGEWSWNEFLLISLVMTTTTALALLPIWTVGSAASSGLLSRSAVIGMHVSALAVLFFTSLPSMAYPPMLVVFISMLIAFARFVRTPLRARI
jgi:hypothetical protein